MRLALVALAVFTAGTAGAAPPTLSSTQLVVVTTPSWRSTAGRLQRYEKIAGVWSRVGEAVDVVVGESGLGWGLGLQDVTGGANEPRKMEGDGRAPAGVFRLDGVMGKGGVPMTKMAKHTLEKGDVCVDDVTSGDYNRLLLPRPPPETPAATPPPVDKDAFDTGEEPVVTGFKSAEILLRRDALYDLMVVVDHNATDSLHLKGSPRTAEALPKPIRGRGSCVFLHVWRRPASPTVGCTAMSQSNLADVVVWLDPDQQPLLVQLPRDVYARQREPWALP